MPPLEDDATGNGAIAGGADGRLGLSTFRSFSFVRDGVRQVMDCSSKGLTSLKDIREHTQLGTIQVEAMPRFAKAAGMQDKDGLPTALGRTLLRNDPGLADCRSQWIVHYKLACRHTAGPGFWPELFDYITTKSSITADDLRSYLADRAGDAAGDRAIQYACVAFLGTYTKTECLGSLGILVEEDGTIATGQGTVPPPTVVAYVIADYWDNEWTGRTSVNLGWMSDPGGPGSLLMMNSGEIGDALREMQNAGLVELQRRQAPYQVFRTWADTDELLERIYD